MSQNVFLIQNQALPRDPSSFLEEELEPRMAGLKRKARLNKALFFALRAVAILGGLALPYLISQMGEETAWPIAVSIAIAAAVGLEEVFAFKIAFLKYSALWSLVDQERTEFAAEIAEYADLEPQARLRKFIGVVGVLIGQHERKLLDLFGQLKPVAQPQVEA